METMYDRLGELLSETLEAGEVRFVSTSALHSSHEEARGNGAQGEARAHTDAQAGSAHTQAAQGSAHGEDALHTGRQREARAHAKGEESRTQAQAGKRQGCSGWHTASGGAWQADFRPLNEELHGTASAQPGGYSGTAKPYTFQQFAPRVARLSEEEMRALRLLDLTAAATAEDVKRAYKEKLKYFHPDKYDKNEVLKTVATKKTRMIVEAYELLSKHFAPQDGKS